MREERWHWYDWIGVAGALFVVGSVIYTIFAIIDWVVTK